MHENSWLFPPNFYNSNPHLFLITADLPVLRNKMVILQYTEIEAEKRTDKEQQWLWPWLQMVQSSRLAVLTSVRPTNWATEWRCEIHGGELCMWRHELRRDRLLYILFFFFFLVLIWRVFLSEESWNIAPCPKYGPIKDRSVYSH